MDGGVHRPDHPGVGAATLGHPAQASLIEAARLFGLSRICKSLPLVLGIDSLLQISTCCMAGLTWWAIANGLGAHTEDLSMYERGVQFQVFPSI